MKRREFIAVLGGAAVIRPRATRAQPGDMRKLGVLMGRAENDPDSKLIIAAFRTGLRDLGWRDGENIRIEYRWSDGLPDLNRRYAQELVALAPDVILANGTPVISALKPLAGSIPIVCALIVDPVGFGFVESLGRPGGNITGFSFIDSELIGKWMELLKEAAPGLSRGALLYNPRLNPWYPNIQRELAAQQSAAIDLQLVTIEAVEQLQPTIEALSRTAGTGLIVGPDSLMIVHMREVAQLAASNRLPGISVYRQFVVEGGLMTYGPNVPDIFRRSASYVDRILRGENPATLPVQQPTKFEFVINQNAARSLGLTLSPALLAGADDMIE